MTVIYWDVAASCNARCAYCSAARTRAAAPDRPQPLESALRALDHLRTAGVESLILLGGEPTLYPDLIPLARAAVSAGMQVGIATNGLALTRDLRRELLGLGRVAVNFSIDSIHARENDAVRGAGHHARSLTNLRALLEERCRACAPMRVTIQATLTRVNLTRLEDSLPRLCDLGVDGVLLERMRSYAWQSPAARALAPEPGEWILGACRLARAAMRLGDPGRLVLNYGELRLRAALRERFGYPASLERRCTGGWRAAVLGLDGRLHPCRHVLERPVPRRADGRAWFAIDAPRADADEAARFLESAYFVDFFNFAHSAEVYERVPLCRACPHYADCEPCPLDVVTHGERAVCECEHLARHGLPECGSLPGAPVAEAAR
jgi:MoaA/NifB/PqqE/SkfB family radical SAM enzyme